jgi:hypothetical protein
MPGYGLIAPESGSGYRGGALPGGSPDIGSDFYSQHQAGLRQRLQYAAAADQAVSDNQDAPSLAGITPAGWNLHASLGGAEATNKLQNRIREVARQAMQRNRQAMPDDTLAQQQFPDRPPNLDDPSQVLSPMQALLWAGNNIHNEDSAIAERAQQIFSIHNI